MAAQNIAEKFDIGLENSEPKEIKEVYKLDSLKIIELLNKLDSHEDFIVHLRGKGFEIYGRVDDHEIFKDESFGIITSGYNLNKSSFDPYLVSFNFNNKHKHESLIPKTNLIDIIREYIV